MRPTREDGRRGVRPPTPPLPLAPLPLPHPEPGRDLTPTEAHRVMLYCALDAASVPVRRSDAAAVMCIAGLDYPTVSAVIHWLTQARSTSAP